jgi:hypothetical protein
MAGSVTYCTASGASMIGHLVEAWIARQSRMFVNVHSSQRLLQQRQIQVVEVHTSSARRNNFPVSSACERGEAEALLPL